MSNYFDLIFWDLVKEEGSVDIERLEKIYNSRECILNCLYAISVLYENLKKPYEEFKAMYEYKPLEELRNMLDRKIRNYKGRKSLDEWKEEMNIIRYAKSLRNKKVKDLKSPMESGREIYSLIDFFMSVKREFGNKE